MEVAKPKKSMKMKANKVKAKKVVVSKTKKGYVKKSSKAVIKAASRISKKCMILDKSETKNSYSGDEFQSEKILSTPLKGQIPFDDISHENIVQNKLRIYKFIWTGNYFR